MSGDASKEDFWRGIFNEHKEFFRKSPNDLDHYALVWRRALPRRFYRRLSKMLSQDEYEELSEKEKLLVSRPPIPEPQIGTLVDIAITLHARQTDQHRDWRWWVPIVVGFIGSGIGAIIGVLATAWRLK